MISTTTAVLSARGLTKEFRGFTAVDNVDLDVVEGTVHALVGPNGAGKSTLFNLLTGFLTPTSGSIAIDGKDATHLRPDQVANLGVARSFQITSLFENLTCREHLELALQAGTDLGTRFWRAPTLPAALQDRAVELLDQVGLAGQEDVLAGELAYGRKRALELAIALSRNPRLMLLDEPTAGMGLEDVSRTVALINRIREGRTVVLIEHNMRVVGDLADTVTVLQRGSVLIQGSYEAVRSDPQVIAAYLGDSGVEDS